MALFGIAHIALPAAQVTDSALSETAVPVLRGLDHAVTLEQARAFFDSLGPGAAMIIKAIAGGGGRGTRAVQSAEEIEPAFARCQSEALSSFGRADVFVEQFITRARHVEVQILGDRQGSVTHLGERECSLQRRFQKIVEIAPAPCLDDALRRGALSALAVTASSYSSGVHWSFCQTADRERFRALGSRISEFPVRENVAEAAVAAGDLTVFGAPNVLRGGSHTGCPSAAEMVQKGKCSVLASDYYYPSLLHAPFVLEERYGVSLPQAWELVSGAPARAAGLMDRGQIAHGMRGDVILVERRGPLDVSVVCVISNGRLVHMTTAELLRSN